MDKNNNRKVRMEPTPRKGHNSKMEETLLDRAIDLAQQTFADPCEEHVCGLFSQLIYNWKRGLGEIGVGTVH